MYNLNLWEKHQLELNVQAHLYSYDGEAVGNLTHYAHFYSPKNLDLTLRGRRLSIDNSWAPEVAVIVCNNIVLARLYLDPKEFGTSSNMFSSYSINLDIGETIAIHE